MTVGVTPALSGGDSLPGDRADLPTLAPTVPAKKVKSNRGRPAFERVIVAGKIFIKQPDGSLKPDYKPLPERAIVNTAPNSAPLVLTLTKNKRANSDVGLARDGDFDAFYRIAAFNPYSSPEYPALLRRDECQEQIIKCHAADLLCKYCGKWHGQDPITSDVGDDGQAKLKAVTCPHCGMEDCAGPLLHCDISGMTCSKSTVTLSALWPFRLGRMSIKGIRPQAYVVGSSKEESVKRLAYIEFALFQPVYHQIFGDTLKPLAAKSRTSITCHGYGKKWPVVDAQTARQFASGQYPHLIVLDDVSNPNTERLRPADGRKLKEKVQINILQGKPPHIIIDVVGNVVTETDTNSCLLNEAVHNPRTWSSLQLKATWRRGTQDPATNEWVVSDVPEAVELNGKDGRPYRVKSYWPQGLPDTAIEASLRRNEFVGLASYFCQPIRKGDLAFSGFDFWVYGNKDRLNPVFKNLLTDVPVYDAEDLRALDKIHAIDLGMTGADAADLRNRSESSFWTVGRDRKTGKHIALFAKTDMVAAGQHLRWLDTMEALNDTTRTVAFEALGVGAVEKQRIGDAGWTVVPYNPSTKGDKVFRKVDLVSFANRGRILMRGQCTIAEGKPVIVIHPDQKKAWEDLMLWPHKGWDTADGLEIACGTLWKWFGQDVTEATSKATEKKDDIWDDIGYRGEAKEQTDADLVAVAAGSAYEDAAVFGLLSA